MHKLHCQRCLWGTFHYMWYLTVYVRNKKNLVSWILRKVHENKDSHSASQHIAYSITSALTFPQVDLKVLPCILCALHVPPLFHQAQKGTQQEVCGQFEPSQDLGWHTSNILAHCSQAFIAVWKDMRENSSAKIKIQTLRSYKAPLHPTIGNVWWQHLWRQISTCLQSSFCFHLFCQSHTLQGTSSNNL